MVEARGRKIDSITLWMLSCRKREMRADKKGNNTGIIGVTAHPLDRISKLDPSTKRTKIVLEKVALQISRRLIAARNRPFRVGPIFTTEVFFNFEGRSRGCAITPMITVYEVLEQQQPLKSDWRGVLALQTLPRHTPDVQDILYVSRV